MRFILQVVLFSIRNENYNIIFCYFHLILYIMQLNGIMFLKIPGGNKCFFTKMICICVTAHVCDRNRHTGNSDIKRVNEEETLRLLFLFCLFLHLLVFAPTKCINIKQSFEAFVFRTLNRHTGKRQSKSLIISYVYVLH